MGKLSRDPVVKTGGKQVPKKGSMGAMPGTHRGSMTNPAAGKTGSRTGKSSRGQKGLF